MIKFAVGFVLSLMFTNWAVNELQYFSPGLGSSVQAQLNSLSFPRHDRWGEIVTASGPSDLNEKVEKSYESFSFSKSIKGLFSYLKPARYFAKRGRKVNQYAKGSIFEPLFTTFSASDNGMFTSLFSDLDEGNQLARF